MSADEWKPGDFAALRDGTPVLILERLRSGRYGIMFCQNAEPCVNETGFRSGGSCYGQPGADLRPITRTDALLFVAQAKTSKALFLARCEVGRLEDELEALTEARRLLNDKSLAPVVGAEDGEQARNDYPLPVATAEPGPGGTDDGPGRASIEEAP